MKFDTFFHGLLRKRVIRGVVTLDLHEFSKTHQVKTIFKNNGIPASLLRL
jgi:hypothetical protein